MKKRFLSMILVVAMLVTMMPMVTMKAAATSTIIASGNCGEVWDNEHDWFCGDGDNITWTLDSDGVVTISGSGRMFSDMLIDSHWRNEDLLSDPASPEMIKKVIINYGVENIGGCAFYKCENLTEISIPSSVTEIQDCAFERCTSLKSIIIPASVETIAESAFAGCTALTDVYYLDFEPYWWSRFGSGLSNIDQNKMHFPYLAGDKDNREDPNSDIRYSLFEDGTLIFSGKGSMCPEYTAVLEVTPWNDQFNSYQVLYPVTRAIIENGITNVGSGVLNNMINLQSVKIPDSVTSIDDSAFYGCEKLTSVNIPSSVTRIGDYAFYGCKKLSNITIPKGVTYIGNSAFYDCINISNITIPGGVTSIGELAFHNCYQLDNVVISEGVTSIGDYAFQYATQTNNLYLPSTLQSIGSGAFDCVMFQNVYYNGTREDWSNVTGNHEISENDLRFNEPYAIGTADDLIAFANYVNNYTGECSVDAYLTADIDMTGKTMKQIAALDSTNGNVLVKYAGTFDGRGHTISNVNMTVHNEWHMGLFGAVSGTIKNLMLRNCDIEQGSNFGGAGGIIGHCMNATLINCGFIGRMHSNYGGLLVGTVPEGYTCTFENCWAVSLRDVHDMDFTSSGNGGRDTQTNCFISRNQGSTWSSYWTNGRPDGILTTADVVTSLNSSAEYQWVDCGASPAFAHKLTHVDAVAATATTAGNNEYYICEICSKAFKDENAATPTTVEEETLEAYGYAVNNTTGISYATLAAALNEASAGDTIKVLYDVNEPIVRVKADVALDLNGFNVTAEYILATGNIVDTSADKGVLKANDYYMNAAANTDYLNIRNGEGYSFYKAAVTSGMKGSNTIRFRFNKLSGDYEAAMAAMKATDNGGIQGVLVVEWSKGGYEYSQTITVPTALLKQYIDNHATKMLTATVVGLDAADMESATIRAEFKAVGGATYQVEGSEFDLEITEE